MKHVFGISYTVELFDKELNCTVNTRDLDLPTQNITVQFCPKQHVRHAVINAGPKEMGKIAENIARMRYGLSKGTSTEFDYMLGDDRIEIKSSRAFHKGKRGQLVMAKDLPFITKYNCNIQQIKRDLFDVLMYMVFSHDVVQVFIINSNDIESANIGYSNKQHRNNEGEGQFHIQSSNYSLHLPMLVDELSYKDCYDILLRENKAMSHINSFH